MLAREGRLSLAILQSRAQLGTDAPPVTIEVFLSGGLPSFSVVGMAETAVRESKDRVRSALISSDFKFPQERITVSLGPADMRKSGGRFDLAIALGILAASNQLPLEAVNGVEFYGELALNGDLRQVPAILPAALKANDSGHSMIVPLPNASEAALAKTVVRPATTLLEVTAHLNGSHSIDKMDSVRPGVARAAAPDLADVKGQTRTRNRSGRRTQPAVHRSSGYRQEHAGKTPCRSPAGNDRGGGAGNRRD
jgi:magnesium chelatase family protein